MFLPGDKLQNYSTHQPNVKQASKIINLSYEQVSSFVLHGITGPAGLCAFKQQLCTLQSTALRRASRLTQICCTSLIKNLNNLTPEQIFNEALYEPAQGTRPPRGF